MGKTRDLVKKIKDTRRTFHTKMGTIKDRKSMDLKKEEGTRKKWQDYTQKKQSVLYRTGGRDKDHPQGKEIQKGKMVV